MTKTEQFFKEYQQGANSFDPDLVAPQFTESFMGGDPNGVTCIINNDTFRAAIPKQQAFFHPQRNTDSTVQAR